jgi:hypothetical protein
MLAAILALALAEPGPDAVPETGAIGGQGLSPLPEAPAPVDPASIARGPWRGRWLLDISLGVSVPLGGSPPGAGGVVSGQGGAAFGARLHPIVAVGTGLATFVHDAATRDVVDDDGQVVRAVGLGRVTAFEAGFVRLYVPRPRRIEPRFDVALLLGPYRPPFGGPRRLAAGLRAGAGVDFWLGPTFTLALEASYRLLAIERNVGHGLQTTLGMGIHW